MNAQMDTGQGITGKVALVTGGTRGIGLAIARRLAAAGAKVTVCGRSASEGLGEIEFVACDVRDPDAVRAMIDGIAARHGRFDILVNNAGGSPEADSATASPRFAERIVALNLLAPLNLAQAAHPHMQAHGGSIVNIASVSAQRPSPGTAVYSAAKAGLIALGRSLAHEWGPAIRVNAIIVGYIETESDRGDLWRRLPTRPRSPAISGRAGWVARTRSPKPCCSWPPPPHPTSPAPRSKCMAAASVLPFLDILKEQSRMSRDDIARSPSSPVPAGARAPASRARWARRAIPSTSPAAPRSKAIGGAARHDRRHRRRRSTQAGGRGIAVAVDHRDDAAVAALFAQVERDEGRLDILVNNAAIIDDALIQPGGFWERPLCAGRHSRCRAAIGLCGELPCSAADDPHRRRTDRLHLVVRVRLLHARPCLWCAEGRCGQVRGRYGRRSARIEDIAAVSIWMGPLKTERTDKAVAERPDQYEEIMKTAETPEFTGTLIAAIHADPERMSLTGQTLIGAELGERYGITRLRRSSSPPSFRGDARRAAHPHPASFAKRTDSDRLLSQEADRAGCEQRERRHGGDEDRPKTDQGTMRAAIRQQVDAAPPPALEPIDDKIIAALRQSGPHRQSRSCPPDRRQRGDGAHPPAQAGGEQARCVWWRCAI